ncbi:hypothetical protein K458DRAFT_434273 [Lentithecium fluviatile CBS 122367]|uniref:Uncharacterized protein n=1 Tax=Lentithecium fluviatile CBS 122367 TaxID=1168545 RepID=A0A6G1IRI0_9PLEO|nr:hypothetical protein K458DRAFT_434273 [Lentithecium fluviatile CBS 122367]
MQRDACSSSPVLEFSAKYHEIIPGEMPNDDQIQQQLLEYDDTITPDEKTSGFDSEDFTERTPTAPFQPLPVSVRFSSYFRIATIVSTISLLATIAFLAYLWNSNDSNSTWRKIVLTNWITRSATLSALVLRIAVSVQAGIVTSMLASLILEGSGIRLSDVLEISIMRFSNNGPHTLFWVYARQARSVGLVLLLTTLTFSTLATQFSSTLLLSDVASISIPAPTEKSPTPFGFNTQNFRGRNRNLYAGLWTSKYWTHIITEYPSFGEYSKPVEPVDWKNDVDDTGTVIRSMIPFAEKSTRERLSEYQGPAFSFDARVVCVQPEFLSMRTCENLGSRQSGVICGKVKPRRTADFGVFNVNGSEYECALPTSSDVLFKEREPIYEHRTSPKWTMCRLNSSIAGGLISVLDPTNDASLSHSWQVLDSRDPGNGTWAASDGYDSWPVHLGNAYLVLNASQDMFTRWNKWNRSTNATYVGPWAEIAYPAPRNIHRPAESFKFRVSLCYDALPSNTWFDQIQDWNIRLTSSKPRKEPTTSSRLDRTGFDTTSVRQQLGAVSVPGKLEERGILELSGEGLLEAVRKKRSGWTCPNLAALINSTLPNGTWNRPQWDYKSDWGRMPTFSWVTQTVLDSMLPPTGQFFCLYCMSMSNSISEPPASPIHSSIFNDALTDTRSPARALQAYLTTVLRQAYYSWLPLFNAQTTTITISYVDRLAPISRRGYWTVMGILATHIVVCGITTYLFFSRTRHSLLGNVWAAYAQVTQTEQAQTLLRDGTIMSDREVLRVLKSQDGALKRYRVAVDKDNEATLAPVSRAKSEG